VRQRRRAAINGDDFIARARNRAFQEEAHRVVVFGEQDAARDAAFGLCRHGLIRRFLRRRT